MAFSGLGHIYFLYSLLNLHSHFYQGNAASEGDVRLVDGPSDNYGILELYHRGRWGIVCDNHWYDFNAARIVCNQLSYKDGITKSGIWYILNLSEDVQAARESVPLHISHVQCSGHEKNLLDCNYTSPDEFCSYDDSAGVKCLGSRIPTTLPPDTTTRPLVKTNKGLDTTAAAPDTSNDPYSENGALMSNNQPNFASAGVKLPSELPKFIYLIIVVTALYVHVT